MKKSELKRYILEKRETQSLFRAMKEVQLKESYLVTLEDKETLTKDGSAVHILPAEEFFAR